MGTSLYSLYSRTAHNKHYVQDALVWPAVASHERWQRAKVRETGSAFPFKHLAGAVALVLPGFVRLTLRTAGPNRLAFPDPDEDCETGASLSPVTAGS